ncbi:MAG: damage-inducible protein DinB [Rhodothermales bacterium]|nr:damage-inducible protein DinB [Rhodothermales bacterium]
MLNHIFDHQTWADLRTLESLRGAPAPKALSLFAHIIGAETIWADRIDGRPQSMPVWPAANLDVLAGAVPEVAQRYRGFCQADQARIVHYTNSDGHRFSTALSDILVHVALHGAYHRGQVALLLRGTDAEPAPTDYIEFVRGQPAAKNH